MKTETGTTSFLPNFCAIRMVFALVVTAELLAIMLSLAVGDEAFWSDLSLRSLYIQWVVLGTAAILCALRRSLANLGHTAAGFVAWGITLFVTATIHALAQRSTGGQFVWNSVDVLRHVLIAGIIGAVVLRYLYEQFRERERERAEVQARVQALQARIRPHFLFNSMNTIANLTRADPVLAEEVVQDLSDLFRASLSDGRVMTTLAEELELARGYLRIEQQRLGDRLRVVWDVADLPLHAPMPALLLQPLLENAVYHGIEPSEEGGEIGIAARYRNDVVNISIRNTLPKTPAGSVREGNRIAMENVRERLATVFGEAAGLTVGTVDDCYQVRLFLPCRESG